MCAVYFSSGVTGAIEAIRCEIDPTFTRPENVSELPEGDTPVREIFAVHPSGCDSTVVVEYSLPSDFFEAERGMGKSLVGVE